MPYRELVEWIAYYQTDPFGEHRQDDRIAMLCSVLANCHRGKNTRPFKPSDFALKYSQPKRKPADMYQHFLRMTKMVGGTVINGNGRTDQHPAAGQD